MTRVLGRAGASSPSSSRGWGLYVHVPFCARACPYCDFDFQVGRNPPWQRWLEGLERERLAREGEGEWPADMVWDTVYVGGGTPSMLGPDGVEALGRWLDRHFPGQRREFTVEVNPEHVDGPLVAALKAAGVTRVSAGLQSFESRGLVMLGRVHDDRQALAALRTCAEAGLRRSADLIVGWPGQRDAELDRDLDRLVEEGVEHVSVYALTIESGTPWEALERRGTRLPVDDGHQADLLARVESRLREAGFEHYEVASYARPGGRALHNERYWCWESYVGLGPSAASANYSDRAVVRRRNIRGLDAWLADPGRAAEVERLEGEAAAAEALWLGLRRLGGFEVDGLREQFAVTRRWVEQRVRRQVELGNLRWEGDRLSLGPQRWLFHDTIAADLLG